MGRGRIKEKRRWGNEGRVRKDGKRGDGGGKGMVSHSGTRGLGDSLLKQSSRGCGKGEKSSCLGRRERASANDAWWKGNAHGDDLQYAASFALTAAEPMASSLSCGILVKPA